MIMYAGGGPRAPFAAAHFSPVCGAKCYIALTRIRVRIGDGRVPLLKTHKYSVGQNVRYIAGPFSRFGASGTFKIVKLLPPEGDEQQYRIKSAGEAFERVAKESQLDRD